GDALRVAATDLDISISSQHACEVLAEGQLAVPARQLFEIVRSLPGTEVVLKRAKNKYLELTSGSAHFRLVGMGAEDFPALPHFDNVPFVQIDPRLLLEMIDLTSFAISTDDTRYNLTGVFFEPLPGVLRTVATDGHRLSLSERSLEGDFRVSKGLILPRKGLAEMKKLLLETAPSDDQTQLGFATNSAIVTRPQATLAMRLLEGVFPDYRQVIPKTGDKLFTVGRARLLETLHRVSLLSTDRAHAVRLELLPGVLRVTSQNPEVGEAREEVPIEYQGDSLSIGFNARYLMDVLTALAALPPSAADDVLFELADDLSPGVIKPRGESPTRFTGVVMPMRI
ncbi:MAG TPA: DNA polymerase III subunit beta, partial [Anaeromyxobacteraceae bacterium]|nr:DNA polymerase III subunit beta [Anaeromyxobacteraceae bacterium]